MRPQNRRGKRVSPESQNLVPVPFCFWKRTARGSWDSLRGETFLRASFQPVYSDFLAKFCLLFVFWLSACKFWFRDSLSLSPFLTLVLLALPFSYFMSAWDMTSILGRKIPLRSGDNFAKWALLPSTLFLGKIWLAKCAPASWDWAETICTNAEMRSSDNFQVGRRRDGDEGEGKHFSIFALENNVTMIRVFCTNIPKTRDPLFPSLSVAPQLWKITMTITSLLARNLYISREGDVETRIA